MPAIGQVGQQVIKNSTEDEIQDHAGLDASRDFTPSLRPLHSLEGHAALVLGCQAGRRGDYQRRDNKKQ
jgi:hypothetical protein